VGALAPFSFLVQVEQYISIEWNTDSYIATLKRQTEHLRNENDVILKKVYFFYLSLVFKNTFFAQSNKPAFLDLANKILISGLQGLHQLPGRPQRRQV